MHMYLIVIVGAGLAGLECGRSLLNYGISNFIILEKNNTIVKKNSWKTFPSVVWKFRLESCVATDVNRIFFRSFSLNEQKIIHSNSPSISCSVLDSDKVYAFYNDILKDHIRLNSEVIGVSYDQENYDISLSDGTHIESFILIDASGAKPISDLYFSDDWFKQGAYYLCYAKRYRNCNSMPIRHDAFFDFDDPLKACGCWCYPIDDTTAEIGVARFTGEFGISDDLKKELDLQIDQYKKVPPFNEVFGESSEEIATISGFCPLLPRINNRIGNLYCIGDAKGAVPYSGYGTKNALESGRLCAESIAKGKKYNYFVTPPSAGLAILNLLWHLDPMRLKNQARGISMLSSKDVRKFFEGNIDLPFFIRANKISKKLGNNLIGLLPKGMILRVLFNRMPIQKDYDKWF